MTAVRKKELMVFSIVYKVKPCEVKCNRHASIASVTLSWYLVKKDETS
jgi:hypothetical protein